MKREGSGAKMLLDIIKTQGYNKDVEVQYATVTSIDPYLFELNVSKIELDSDDYVIPEHLLAHSRQTTDGQTINFATSLHVGDVVLVLADDDVWKYYILGKVGQL